MFRELRCSANPEHRRFAKTQVVRERWEEVLAHGRPRISGNPNNELPYREVVSTTYECGCEGPDGQPCPGKVDWSDGNA